MRMRAQFLPVLFVSITLTAIPLTAQSSHGGGGGKGHKPPTEVTTNLSYPAYFYGSSPLTGSDIGTYTLDGQWGFGMSYGCLIPEEIGTTTYPNTSCINEDGSFQSYETCQVTCGSATVERIYWEKDLTNKWQAGYSVSEGSYQLPVSYIDWGDNLESKTWPVQVLRVETNTFSALPVFDPTEVKRIADNPGVRFEMWHVAGQGTDELWGVHATNADPPIPYVYFTNDTETSSVLYWPYAVNYSNSVMLNITKLEAGVLGCPGAATGQSQSPFQGEDNLTWDKSAHVWTDAPYHNPLVYGAELNIKGSYVYGYNWNLGSEPVPPDVSRAGWWRLTFYTSDDSIDFSTWNEPTSTDNTLAPPAPPATVDLISDESPSNDLTQRGLQTRTRLRQQAAVGGVLPAAEAETGAMLYVPQVDKDNNLTYLDICISASHGGGSSGKGKKP